MDDTFWNFFRYSNICIYGQYLAITRFTGRKTIYRILFRNLLFLLLLILFGHYFLKFNVPEVKVNILIWIVLNTLMGFFRLFIKDIFYIKKIIKKRRKINVAIYGAGEAGVQLAENIQSTNSYKIIAFIDDNPILWDRRLNGIQVIPLKSLEKIKDKIEKILLAIPSASNRKKEILLINFKNLKFLFL